MENCVLCDIPVRDTGRILFQDDFFFVTPSLGPIVEGHLLICSKEHLPAMGYLDKEWGRKLRTIREKIEQIFLEVYGEKALMFEHGEIKGVCKSSGTCIDHLHLHILPLNISLREKIIQDGFGVQEIESLKELADYVKQKKPYLFVHDKNGRYVSISRENIPSQYLRRITAEKIGEEQWGWREFPRKAIFEETLLRLRPFFQKSSSR